MENKKNVVLVANSNWSVVDSVSNGRVNTARPKQPYARVFGRYVRIDRSDTKLYLNEGFEVIYR